MANTVDKVIKIALDEVGYLEKKSNSQLDSKTANAGSNNYTKYARDLDAISGFYNGKKNGAPWCDCFNDWCFVKAFGVNDAKSLLCQPSNSLGAGCGYSMNYYKNKGQFHTANPKIGDQIFFWNSAKTGVAHTGIVYDVDNTYVYTVEGNTSGASGVISNGGGVCKKKYSLSYGFIAGYGRPKYDTVEQAKPSTPNRIDTVKEVQNWLNANYNARIAEDGIYGNLTKKALVKALQTELNNEYNSKLVVDGIWGAKTRAACPTLVKGSKGGTVGVLQALLVCNKIDNIYVDKDYGNITKSSVEKYQAKKGLVVDGKAGKDTFAKLCS